ncbi:hypothetical protein PR048_000429 [Dryococelus australis]|uniref:Uncharacterized protein n=1 Tax=Dryococelus australis TaxID=614101 RepID=A0ABQ9IFT3_9NEOP|nr:hypothetical protein PR048_000429 [Dryococelus australis]
MWGRSVPVARAIPCGDAVAQWIEIYHDRGDVGARIHASHLGEPKVRFQAGSLLSFRMYPKDATDQRVFSWITFIGSQDLDVKNYPNLLLLAFHQGEPGSFRGRFTPGFSHAGIACRTVLLIGGFSRGSTLSPAPSFRCSSILTSISSFSSQDLAVNSRANLFTRLELNCAMSSSLVRSRLCSSRLSYLPPMKLPDGLNSASTLFGREHFAGFGLIRGSNYSPLVLSSQTGIGPWSHTQNATWKFTPAWIQDDRLLAISTAAALWFRLVFIFTEPFNGFLVPQRQPHFQQDDARPRTARVSLTCLRDGSTLPRPASSPEFSAVQNVRDQIGRKLLPAATSVYLEGLSRQLWCDLPQTNNNGRLHASVSDRIVIYLHAADMSAETRNDRAAEIQHQRSTYAPKNPRHGSRERIQIRNCDDRARTNPVQQGLTANGGRAGHGKAPHLEGAFFDRFPKFEGNRSKNAPSRPIRWRKACPHSHKGNLTGEVGTAMVHTVRPNRKWVGRYGCVVLPPDRRAINPDLFDPTTCLHALKPGCTNIIPDPRSNDRSSEPASSLIMIRSRIEFRTTMVQLGIRPLPGRQTPRLSAGPDHPVWHALYECLQDIHGDSSPFLLQPFHELSNGFWPHLTSPHPAIQFVPNMFYRVEVGALGGPVQSANIVVGKPRGAPYALKLRCDWPVYETWCGTCHQMKGRVQLPNLVRNMAVQGGKCQDGCRTSPYTGRYGGPCTSFYGIWYRAISL